MVPKYMPQGQPISSDKLEAFNAMCGKMENCSKLYTIKEFHKAMQKKKDDNCPSKTTKIKLKEKYDDSVQFAMFVIMLVVF